MDYKMPYVILPSTNQLFCKISSYNMGIFLFTCL